MDSTQRFEFDTRGVFVVPGAIQALGGQQLLDDLNADFTAAAGEVDPETGHMPPFPSGDGRGGLHFGKSFRALLDNPHMAVLKHDTRAQAATLDPCGMHKILAYLCSDCATRRWLFSDILSREFSKS
jgi:hypothetical protein